MAPDHEILLTLISLESRSGRRYVGCDVPEAALSSYLELLQEREPVEFSSLRKNQFDRDLGKFHITAISPPEYLVVERHVSAEIFGSTAQVTLHGLGVVTSIYGKTYFVVAGCPLIDQLRQTLRLPHRDLHVTIGFDGRDVHNARKDSSTLLSPATKQGK